MLAGIEMDYMEAFLTTNEVRSLRTKSLVTGPTATAKAHLCRLSSSSAAT